MKRLSTIYLLVAASFFSYWGNPVLATTYYVNPGESIQAAIDSASYGDTVEVSAGTYVENITLKNGIALIGEVSNDFLVTVIERNYDDTVVKSSNCDPNTILQAFRIKFGRALQSFGGGMHNSESSPTVTNCWFGRNEALAFGGGGMYNDESSPTVTNCTFSGNYTGGNGGGMYNNYSSPTIINCTFAINISGRGGGMYNKYSNPTVINCTFSNNSAEYFGGGMYNESSNPTMTNCIFNHNGADLGGGMYNDTSSLTIINCTFGDNEADSGGGIWTKTSNLILANCILWGNSKAIHIDDTLFPTITYSDIEGSYPGDGNIDADPLFVDPANGDFRLLPGSPCIDAGNNGAVPAGITADIDGLPRFLDDSDTIDTGSGTLPIVDMGAYEYCLAVNAVFTAAPNPAVPGEDVVFDGSSSFCYDPPEWDNSIISYEWDFDYDGVNFDVEDTVVTVLHAYGLFGIYDVALRVTDDDVPANIDIGIMAVEVSLGNHAPVADAGGPYMVNQNQSLFLDASASTPGGDDAYYGDAVILYEWDLEADGKYDDHITTDAITTVPWSTLSILSRPVGQSPPIYLRVNDILGLTDTASTTLMVTYEPKSWGSLIVDSNGDVGYQTSLAMDSDDNPRISYYDCTNGSLKYAFWNGSNWDIEDVDSSGNAGDYSSLVLDSFDNPYISYYDYSNMELKYASWNGVSWDIETVDSSGTVGQYSCLALDSDGNPCISYYDYSNTNLKYASWNGSSWDIETVDSSIGNVGRYTSLALDSYNNPRISYFDWSNYDLKYARWNGTSWLKQTVDSAGNAGIYGSLALDSDDNPSISYYDYSNGNLKYAFWNGASWDIEIVDSGGVGQYTCIALDSDSNPRISYYDYTNGNLKYACWNGVNWDIQTVVNNADVGYPTSIALDKSCNPLMSYYDYTNGEVKLAVTCVGSLQGDVNHDCRVDIGDVAELAGQWLKCSVPFNLDCAP